MLVQNYLKANGVTSLQDKLKIRVAKHPTDPLLILNYHQIDTPRLDPVGRECRGLVVEADTWKLVARSFTRFFNWGEMLQDMKLFDWTNFATTIKEDGSLVTLYFYGGTWRANTRGSFGLEKLNNLDVTWQDLIWPLVDCTKLNPELTYACELTTPVKRHIRKYGGDSLFLLSTFRGEQELTEDQTDVVAKEVGLSRPNRHYFQSREDVSSFIRKLESDDPSCEGVVIRDCDNRRWKIKTKTYWSLHHMYDTETVTGDKILPWIMNDRGEELFTFFPELKAKYGEMRDCVLAEWDMLRSTWEASQGIADPKEFAKFVVPRTKFNSILFVMRKANETTLEHLEQRWADSDGLILKALKY